MLGLPALLAGLAAASARGDEAPFAVESIPTRGRTVAAELVDVDGDGRADLVYFAFQGLPPRERRLARVHLQRESGGFSPTPSFERELPPGSVAYDVADLRPDPGDELVLLRSDGVAVLSLASPGGRLWTLPVSGGTTVGAAPDERGLEFFKLVWSDFGPEPWLLVPLFGELVALSGAGAELARLDVGARANYYVPRRPGLVAVESDIQLFFDAPHVSAGDVNGDGRTDVVATGRHALRVFLRREDGGFPREPDRELGLGLVSQQDHIRGSGSVSTQARDVDGDGLLDLIVSRTSGSFMDARLETRVHRNRGDGWNLQQPDRVFRSESSVGSDTLVDLDGDGRPELLRSRIPFSLLELVEALFTRSVDARVDCHRLEEGGGFAEKPWFELSLSLPISFETFRTAGFLPQLHADLNADGALDLITSGNGDAVEVRLGGGEKPYRRRHARQQLDSEGSLRLGDFDGDGLQDLLIFDSQHVDAPLILARNRGLLPGTPPVMRDR